MRDWPYEKAMILGRKQDQLLLDLVRKDRAVTAEYALDQIRILHNQA